MGAAGTWLKAVLVACSALEGFEGVREAVPEHGHLAAMAHRAGHEGKAATRLACVGVLYPLWSKTHVKGKKLVGYFIGGKLVQVFSMRARVTPVHYMTHE